MLIGLLLCNQLLRMIHTPAEIYEDSGLYLNIYIWGLPFLFFYNIANGIFSALGDSRTPFLFLAVSSTANILVDILFVKAFEMGVAGVAWATFLCQGISCVCAVFAVLRRIAKIKTNGKTVIFSFPMLGKIAVIAIPSILQQSFISVGNIIIQSVINGFGSGVIAGYAAAIKLNNLVITSFTTLGNGMSNYTAQNIGAGWMSRIREGFCAGVKMIWIFSIFAVALYLLAAKPLVYFFMNEPSEAALNTGIWFLYIVAPFYFVISVKLIADGILRGAGRMREFMIGTFTDLILRVALAIVFARLFGVVGIWCAWPIGWCAAMAISLIFYYQGPWRAKAYNKK